MNRIRGTTVLATFVAVLAAILLAPASASAAKSKPHYPPPPPSLVVDHGQIRYGETVRAYGRRYTAREKVTVTVTYRPNGGSRWRTLRSVSLRADRNGTFSFSTRITTAGLVVITARGASSRTSASAYVWVVDRRKESGHNYWSFRADVRPSAPSAPATGLMVAAVGVLTLAGSGLVTRTLIRRRRRS